MASKTKSLFVCQQCGAQHQKWLGRCPECQAWSSIIEETVVRQKKPHDRRSDGKPVSLREVPRLSEQRTKIDLREFNRVLGGGVVDGSLILIGGEPGIGKSTLLLQVAQGFAKNNKTVLYISGEESQQQIKLRAERLGIDNANILLLAEIDLEAIEAHITNQSPGMVIIDSIQTINHPDISSAPGSVSQVRECAARFQILAKRLNIPIFLVGHVTKDGSIAGPRVLEHIVDTVLYFEGDTNNLFRLLRTIKNRFGASNEVAVFVMHEAGLEQVEHPSEVFLSGRMKGVSGAVALSIMEGTQPLLVELQALVSKANYGMPQRVTSGVDSRRLSLLLAVMEKNEHIPLGIHDVFLNVVGGLRIEEPALDLGVICAVASSFYNIPVPDETAVFGEVGLSGEIRPVYKIEERLKEIERLGFAECLLPMKSLPKKTPCAAVKLNGVATVKEVLQWIRKRGAQQSSSYK